MNDFADQLRHWREFRELSQQQLSDNSHISFNTISELERRVTLRPRMSTAKLLAGALGLTGEDRAAFLAAARAGSEPGARPEAGAGPDASRIERAAPRILRRDIESFTGREDELARLVAAATREPGPGGVVSIHVIEGMGGVGKTSLALRAAHQIAPHFPDGQLFLDLQGYTPRVRRLGPDRALRSLLHALGVPEELLPADRADRAALYRSLLAGTRTLIVLDNAANLAQVEPLLPGTAGCPVIITSRRGLGALEDARTMRLEIPPPGEAIELFCAIAGQETVSRDDENVAKIVDLCGCLPLAIRITAARLAHRRNPSTDEVLADLSKERRRLGHFADEKQDVLAAFEMSFQHLPQDARRTFASLGLIPGADFDAYAAASLAGAASISDVKGRLDTLLDHNLLIDDIPGRFRFHDLVREFAQDKSANASGEDLDRLLDFYLFCAQTADGRLDRRIPAVSPRRYPRTPRTTPELATSAQAHTWFAAEARNLADAARAADERGSPQHAIALSFALAEYLRANGPWNMAAELHRLALDAATRQSDRAGQAAALVHAGVLERQTGNLAAAVSALSRAAGTCPSGARLTLGGALIELGTALRLIGQASEASEKFHAALSAYEAEGSVLGQAGTLRELGGVQFQLGDFGLAEESLSKAFPLYKRLGNRYGEAGTLAYLGGLRLAIKDNAGALEVLDDAYEIYRDLGDPICQANCLLYLGRARLDAGMRDSAKDALLKALGFYTELGDRRGEAGALAFLGDAQRLSGEPELAEKSLSDALSLFHELRDLGGEAETANLHAGLAYSRGEYQAARHRYARALRLARVIPSGKDQADALSGIAECNASECRLAAAVRNYRRALKLYQAMKCDADAARVSAALDKLTAA